MIRTCNVKRNYDLCSKCYKKRRCFEYICPLLECCAILNFSTDKFDTYAILEKDGKIVKVAIDKITDVRTLSITEHQYMINKREKRYVK